MRQLTIVLRCIGLSYRAIQSLLAEWDCPLSATAIRENVRASNGDPAVMSSPLELSWRGDGHASGKDGSLVLRLVETNRGRALEAKAPGGRRSAPVRERIAACRAASRGGVLVDWNRHHVTLAYHRFPRGVVGPARNGTLPSAPTRFAADRGPEEALEERT